jgi:hypothetical protein
MKRRKTSWRKQAVIILTVISSVTGIIVGIKQLFCSSCQEASTSYSYENTVEINNYNVSITVNQFFSDTMPKYLKKKRINYGVGLSGSNPIYVENLFSGLIFIDIPKSKSNNKYAKNRICRINRYAFLYQDRIVDNIMKYIANSGE